MTPGVVEARPPTDGFPAPVGRSRWHASPRDDAISVFTGTWLATGLFVDGWAHNNLRSLETFFTPWHGLLYSGFLVTAAWYFGLAARGGRRLGNAPSLPGLKTLTAGGLTGGGLTGGEGWRGARAALDGRIPVGYGWGVAAVFLFALGGLGDMTWHLAFGIEQGIDALFSPTHVVLALALVAILAAPFRAAWLSPGPRAVRSLLEILPAIMSASLVASVVAFFFMHAWPTLRVFHAARPASPFPLAGGDMRAAAITAGSSGMIVMTLVMVGAILWPLLRWRLPPGAATLTFTVIAALMAGIGGFAHWALILPQIATGIVADVLVHRFDPSPSRPFALRTFAIVVSLVLWVLVLATDLQGRGIGWSREVVGGAVAWSCLAALALALAMTVRPHPPNSSKALSLNPSPAAAGEGSTTPAPF